MVEEVKRFKVKVASKRLRNVSEIDAESVKRGICIASRKDSFLEIMTLDRVSPVRRMCRIDMPSININDYESFLQSVELTMYGSIIIGVAGELNDHLICAAERVAQIIRESGMNGAFFPGYHVRLLSTKPSRFHIGPGAWDLSAFPLNFQHVRVWSKNFGLVFVDVNNVKTISLYDAYLGKWGETRLVRRMERAALYLDRVKRDCVVVPTDKGAFNLDLLSGRMERINPHEDICSGYVSAFLSDIQSLSSEDVGVSMTNSNEAFVVPSSSAVLAQLAHR